MPNTANMVENLYTSYPSSLIPMRFLQGLFIWTYTVGLAILPLAKINENFL